MQENILPIISGPARPPEGPNNRQCRRPSRAHPHFLHPARFGALLINVFFGTLTNTAAEIVWAFSSGFPGGGPKMLDFWPNRPPRRDPFPALPEGEIGPAQAQEQEVTTKFERLG